MVSRRSMLTILAWFCMLACGLLLWSAPAMAARGHVFNGVFGSEGAGNGQFKEPSGVAVNEATGQVYVLDQGDGRVERFSSTGTYEMQFDGSETPATAFSFGTNPLNAGIAVDNSCYFEKLSGSACSTADPSNGDVYVTDADNGVVDKFSPEGIYIGQLQEESGGEAFKFERIMGVAVGTDGTVWVYGPNGIGTVYSFTDEEPNTFIASQGLQWGGKLLTAGASPGFAVDSEDNFYVRETYNEFYAIAKYSSLGESLIEPFEPEETSAVAVDPSSNYVFIDNITSVGIFGASGSLVERIGMDNLTDGSGLAVSNASETVYVADSAANMVNIFGPEPPSKPTAQGESVSDVTGNSATLQGEISSRGASAEYHFEYGPCATLAACATSPYEESVPVPDTPVGSSFAVQSVSEHLQDLFPGTIYHFRVVVHNEYGTVDGNGQIFTTQSAGAPFALPDGRQWEMVSPPNKHGATLEHISESGVIQASADGDSMTYLSRLAPTEAESRGSAANGVQVFSTRGAEEWSSKDIATPHNEATGLSIGQGEEYRYFSEDLSLAVVEPFGPFTPLTGEVSPEASERTVYLRHDATCQTASATCYEPLVTGAPGSANVPPGTEFGGDPGRLRGEVKFVGATPDLSHVVLQSGPALTSTPVANGLYEWFSGKLTLVSLLPGGGPATSAELGYDNTAARNAISDDGSRVVWSANGGHLYMSETTTGQTVQLDVVQPGASGSGRERPHFQIASSDDSKVFFTDEQQLTEGSGAAEYEPDLYECEIVEAAGRLECKLSDLTPKSGSGERADVHDDILGASDDGSYVYFIANGVLAPGAAPARCTGASTTCNLYVSHDGRTTFIVSLSAKDYPDWAGATPTSLDTLTARVSPDGHWLAFMSQRSLTGYVNLDANTGQPDEEVYLYDSRSDHLICASCNPTGARPVGAEYGLAERLVGGHGIWNEKTLLAANIPGWTAFSGSDARYQSRYLSDSGRLFFDSNDALVSQDVNGTEDVYEYEPAGVGNCTNSTSTFSEGSGGCIGLISSGTSSEESAFLDASESGGDVFFLTTAKLLPQDFDTALDVYDAHECTASAPCFTEPAVSPPSCETGESCKASPSLQPSIFGPAGSATFSGAGNIVQLGSKTQVKPKTKPLTRAQKLARALKVCKRKPKHGRAVCERQANKRYGKKADKAILGLNKRFEKEGK